MGICLQIVASLPVSCFSVRNGVSEKVLNLALKQAGTEPLVLNGVLVVEIYCYISEQPQVILLGDAILLVYKVC